MAPVPYQGLPFPPRIWSPQWGNKLVAELRQIFSAPVKVDSYTVAGLPSAVELGAGALVFVTNEAGGPVPAFSDGVAWRRVTDRAIVS